MTRIAIIGAGAFGTALGISLANAGNTVELVARSEEHAADMRRAGENAQRLPGHVLPDGLEPTASLTGQPQVVLAAVPTQAMKSTLTPLAGQLAGLPVVACNKGIDLNTGLGPTGIILDAVPGAHPAALSGPGFAADIAAGRPTAMTIAAAEESLATFLQSTLTTGNLRLYRSTDIAGVEMGGALKNVIAIAAGLAFGAGLGESARAALMTRGYAELTRFALARGARAETLSGLSGFGDLVLTATSERSRNYSHGLALGAGTEVNAGKTVEGVSTAKIVTKLAKKAGIDVPITDLVASILDGKTSVADARDALFSRPLKEE